MAELLGAVMMPGALRDRAGRRVGRGKDIRR
jgi:hypothetical protein